MSVYIVDFEHKIVGWECSLFLKTDPLSLLHVKFNPKHACFMLHVAYQHLGTLGFIQGFIHDAAKQGPNYVYSSDLAPKILLTVPSRQLDVQSQQ